MRTATFAVSVAVICGGSLPVTAGPPTVGYELNASSAYSAGCFGNPGQVPQCQCAILLALDFSGTFGLTPVPGEPGFDTFGVSDIEWTASLQDDVVITGSGTYEIATDASGNPVQRMTLELVFNGGDTVAFDSGLVAGGGGFPDVIEIPISDDFGCPGTRITVGARPSANPADCAPAGGLRARRRRRDCGHPGPPGRHRRVGHAGPPPHRYRRLGFRRHRRLPRRPGRLDLNRS